MATDIMDNGAIVLLLGQRESHHFTAFPIDCCCKGSHMAAGILGQLCCFYISVAADIDTVIMDCNAQYGI